MKPNLVPPARAAWFDEWDNTRGAFRAFDGPEWRIKHSTGHGQRANIVVSVIGLQYEDGRASCEIIIDCPDTPIVTPAVARRLARALIAAADSADSAEGQLACHTSLEDDEIGTAATRAG